MMIDTTQLHWILQDLLFVRGEVVLCIAALVLLVYGVMRKTHDAAELITALSALLLFALSAYSLQGIGEERVLFQHMLMDNAFTHLMKSLTLLSGGLVLLLTYDVQRKNETLIRFEYPILVLFATLGLMLMISAHNLIALYMGLELASLSLYVMASFDRDRLQSSEAGLKYFVLGAVASGIILYGSSLIYGFTGTTRFEDLQLLFSQESLVGPSYFGVIIGLVFIITGLCFKISAVPFHMWTPDVYEGAPTPVTAFFAAAPKIAALSLLVRVMLEPFGPLIASWQEIIIFVSIASMALGAFAALRQSNIKRLLAYSSIGHVGYALVGLAAGTPDGVRGIVLYFILYIFMSVGAFGIVLLMRRKGEPVEQISDLSGLHRTHPRLALLMAIFMFSMAGIPPLAGFFGKMYVFMAAMHAELYGLALIGVLMSVVSAFYYLRIVKIMYIDDVKLPLDREVGLHTRLVLFVSGVIVLFFFVYPAPFLHLAELAANSFVS